MNLRIAAVLAIPAMAFFAGCSQVAPPKEVEPATAKPKVTVDQLALKTDPYCGMSLEHHSVADVYTYKGKLYGFCSSYCKDEFAKDPEKSLAKHGAPAVTSE